ncbi:thioredoxin family protein [Anaerotignum sp.]|uniref:thioredoxin family protein n=1 Tax=Anaerotignum sp. TaxID=2039241 RepID=UPI0037367DAB
MGLFGKKKAEKAEVSSMVKILGSGCTKCNTLEKNTVDALKMLGKEMPVEHVTDFSKIAAYGVMTTPALVYGEKVIIAGRVAKADEIAALLKEVME